MKEKQKESKFLNERNGKKVDYLSRLQKWYLSNCDGDWEHSYGIKIDTIDNPGWRVWISISETELEDKNFSAIKIDRSENDWIECVLQDSYFKGYGGPTNLREILQIFCEWANIED